MQASNSLTPSERAIVEHVEAHNAEALALLERVVNINSGSQNFKGGQEGGGGFAAELRAPGFQTPGGGGRGRGLRAAGGRRSRTVVVVRRGDEEDPGEPLSLAREALVAAAKGAD